MLWFLVTLGKGEQHDLLQIHLCMQSISASEVNGYCMTITLDDEVIENYTQRGLPQGELGTCKVSIWGAVDVERVYKEVEGIVYYTKTNGNQIFTSEESNRVLWLGGLARDIQQIGLAETFTLTFDPPGDDVTEEPSCPYNTYKEYDWVTLTVPLEFTTDGWVLDESTDKSLMVTVNATFKRRLNQATITIPPIMGMNRYDTISTNGSQMLAMYNTMLDTFGWLPEGKLADVTCRIFDKESQEYRDCPGFIAIFAFPTDDDGGSVNMLYHVK